MATLPLHTLQNVLRATVTLPGTISIDAGPDGGFHLPNMRTRFSKAKAHGTVESALENIASSSQATLVGHGLIARINAGAGAVFFPTDSATHLGPTNRDVWKGAIAKLRAHSLQELVLFSCDTGANADGAEFVFALSQALQAKVSAPTGDVWLDETTGQPSLVEGAGFQVATPDMTGPPPVKSLALVPTKAVADRGFAFVFEDGAFLETPRRAIRQVMIRRLGFADRADATTTLEGAAAMQFATSIALNAPIVFGGTPATMVTGTMEMRVGIAGRDVVHHYRIHNHRLIEDVAAPGVFYQFGSPGLMI
jgi:hypothetical protein